MIYHHLTELIGRTPLLLTSRLAGQQADIVVKLEYFNPGGSVKDRVTIYSNTTVLGRVRVGHDSVVGGNLWITHDVPPHSRLRQGKPVNHSTFADGAGI